VRRGNDRPLWGRFETIIGGRHSLAAHLAQVPPADLDIPIVGQLPPPDLPLGDGLEPGLL
jgi:hypothetical protein